MATVLVVDDDPLVLKMLALILRREGFTVLAAGDGIEAMLEWMSHRGEIDLLISDVQMPEIDGPTLASLLLAENPALAVLFISGYPDSAQLNGSQRFELLLKPFSCSTLLTKVRQLAGNGLRTAQ
jgi:two-component system, cell cycle sensor histidine kinase and response regulator CckA